MLYPVELCVLDETPLANSMEDCLDTMNSTLVFRIPASFTTPMMMGQPDN